MIYPDGRWICVIILFVTVRGHACISYQDILYFAWSPLCMVWTALLKHFYSSPLLQWQALPQYLHCHTIPTAQLLNHNSVTAITSHVLVDTRGCYQPLMVVVPRRSSGCIPCGRTCLCSDRRVLGTFANGASLFSICWQPPKVERVFLSFGWKKAWAGLHMRSQPCSKGSARSSHKILIWTWAPKYGLVCNTHVCSVTADFLEWNLCHCLLLKVAS